MIRAAVVTVSDRSFRKEREDASGPAVAQLLLRLPAQVEQQVVVPDERDMIHRALRHFSDELGMDLVVTTGGTGVDPRDVTPEATREVIDRETRDALDRDFTVRWPAGDGRVTGESAAGLLGDASGCITGWGSPALDATRARS